MYSIISSNLNAFNRNSRTDDAAMVLIISGITLLICNKLQKSTPTTTTCSNSPKEQSKHPSEKEIESSVTSNELNEPISIEQSQFFSGMVSRDENDISGEFIMVEKVSREQPLKPVSEDTVPTEHDSFCYSEYIEKYNKCVYTFKDGEKCNNSEEVAGLCQEHYNKLLNI